MPSVLTSRDLTCRNSLVSRPLSLFSVRLLSGYSVFSIGVADVDFVELQEIGSKPSERHVFVVDDFDAFDSIKENLINFICETATSCECANTARKRFEVVTGVGVKLIFSRSTACPLIFLNGFTSPGECSDSSSALNR